MVLLREWKESVPIETQASLLYVYSAQVLWAMGGESICSREARVVGLNLT